MHGTLLHSAEYDWRLWMAVSILLLPLVSFGVLFFLGKRMPLKGDWFACSVMAIAFVLSVVLSLSIYFAEFYGVVYSGEWFSIPYYLTSSTPDKIIPFNWSIALDKFSVVMLTVVTFISLLVHLYSIDYMKERKNYIRYFPYLGLFTSSMTGVVLSDNILTTFVCWELVGLSSYLLIGFWFDKEAAARAAKKAFLINRIGDAGFLIGIFALFVLFSSGEISWMQFKMQNDPVIFQNNQLLFTIAGFGLVLGCIGKSAQFPLQLWLPDAMEGPTPVSALLHAATMVAAGVYLLAKVSFLLTPEVLLFVTIIGALTALLGAVPAMVQHDIKKVLAFSTISQLGYMMMAIGVGAVDAARFHLITHAFFKAGLFLSVGAVIHSMHYLKHKLFIRGYYEDFDTLDMRLMGGLRKNIPITFFSYSITSLALIGVPLFSGFLSKEAIVSAAMHWAKTNDNTVYYIIPGIAFLTILITAFYMIRQWMLVFYGEFKLAKKYPESASVLSSLQDHVWYINIPLAVLAVLSGFIFFSWNPFSFHHSWLMDEHGAYHSSVWIILGSIGMVIAGGAIAYYKYKPSVEGGYTESSCGENSSFGLFLKNNYYMDKWFGGALVLPGLWLSQKISLIDTKVIDRLLHLKAYILVIAANVIAWMDRALVDGLVNGISNFFMFLGRVIKGFTNGKLQDYAWWALFLLIILFITLIICFN